MAARGLRFALKPRQVRPRGFRIHVIGRHRRDAAPVVGARADERRELAGLQVGRRLDRHARPEEEAGDGERPQMLRERRLGRAGHARAGLGAEVLDDDLLQMAVRCVQLAQREERLEPLAPALPDTDQKPRGAGNRQFTGDPERLQAKRRNLVRGAEVRATARCQPLARALEHETHRHRHRAQPREVRARHHARIQVRQEAGLRVHLAGTVLQVRQRARKTELFERAARRRVAQLRLVAEGEKGLLAAGRRSGAGDVEHLFEA